MCSENNLVNELINIRRIVLKNGSKVQHINTLILDIANNKKSENKFNSQKTKSLIFSLLFIIFQAFLGLKI